MKEKKRDNEKEETTLTESVYSETAYDDAFRTMEGKCDDLVLPLVNHMFKENYDGTAIIKRLRNEQYIEHKDGSEEKRITDSSFAVICKYSTKRYHIECESKKYDGSILVRMFEYDTQTAKADGRADLYRAIFKFPNSGLLLLRAPNDTPDSALIELVMPDDRKVTYNIPIMKISDYTVEDIFREKLYMLIPFYIFNYEKKLGEINKNDDEIKNLLEVYEDIFDRLNAEEESGNLSALSHSAIIRLTYSVAYKLTMKKRNIQRKVGDFMGGKVLDLPEFKIFDAGKAEGRAEGRAEGISVGKAEGESERKKLFEENNRLKAEIDELKKRLSS